MIAPALEAEMLLGPEAVDDRQPLARAGVAIVMLVELEAVLLRLVGPPGGDDVERQPPARDVVDVRGLLGEQRRVAVGEVLHDQLVGLPRAGNLLEPLERLSLLVQSLGLPGAVLVILDDAPVRRYGLLEELLLKQRFPDVVLRAGDVQAGQVGHTDVEQHDGAAVPARREQGIQGHIVFENVWFAYKDEDFIESIANRDPFKIYTTQYRADLPEGVQRRGISTYTLNDSTPSRSLRHRSPVAFVAEAMNVAREPL